MENKNSRYLEEEKLSSLMLKFSIPCTLSMVIGALYNIVDQIFIENSDVGTIDITATSVVFPLITIAIAFGLQLGDGTASYMSLCMGKRESSKIGKVIAEKLSVPFYYKETAALAAEESGLSREFISDLNSDSPRRFKELYLSTEVIRDAIAAQDRVIRRIAENGRCVIVSRDANYILRGYPTLLRVFIYAPSDYRIRNVMYVYGDTKDEEEKNIRHSDEARGAYYHSVSSEKWGEGCNYDLLINSSIGIEASAEVILEYVSKKFPGLRQSEESR